VTRAATVDELLAGARARLAAAPFAPSGREASLLLGHVLGLDEARLLARGERPVAAPAAARFTALLERRLGGEPVAYLTGTKEFYGRPFAVDARVLVPRPETEHLVEAALALALPPTPRILDVGTGSGCLAVTLALERPRARLLATDRSPGALVVAAANARRHGVAGRVRLAAADLFAGVRLDRFDLVVSNPPYVDPAERPRLSQEVVDFEPESALFAGDGGLAALAGLVEGGAGLRRGATLLVEIGYGQLAAVEDLARASALHVTAAWPDYSSIPRIVRLDRKA